MCCLPMLTNWYLSKDGWKVLPLSVKIILGKYWVDFAMTPIRKDKNMERVRCKCSMFDLLFKLRVKTKWRRQAFFFCTALLGCIQLSASIKWIDEMNDLQCCLMWLLYSYTITATSLIIIIIIRIYLFAYVIYHSKTNYCRLMIYVYLLYSYKEICSIIKVVG